PVVFNGVAFVNQYNLRSNQIDYDFYLDSLRFTDNSNSIKTYNLIDTNRTVFYADKLPLSHFVAYYTNLYFTHYRSTEFDLVKMGPLRKQTVITLNEQVKKFDLFHTKNGRMQL